MAPSPLREAVVQGAALSVVSSVLAQMIEASQGDKVGDFWVDWIPVFQFLLFSVISTPPNFLWQDFLERTFPAYPPPPHPKKSDEPPPAPKLSIRNTVIKLLLDQSISAVFNTLLFSLFNNTLQTAMAGAPRVTNIFKAVSYWTHAEAIRFHEVDFADVWRQSCDEMWPLLKASWRFWPVIAVVNYTLIQSVRMRGLIGGLAGIVWGTYMSLIASR